VKELPGKGPAGGPRFLVECPFFNRKELFEVTAFYEGVTEDCHVRCRIENTRIRIQKGSDSASFLRPFLFGTSLGTGLFLGLATWPVSVRNLFGFAVVVGVILAVVGSYVAFRRWEDGPYWYRK